MIRTWYTLLFFVLAALWGVWDLISPPGTEPVKAKVPNPWIISEVPKLVYCYVGRSLLLFNRMVASDSFVTLWAVAHQAPLSMG